eukprot:gene20001-1029_t
MSTKRHIVYLAGPDVFRPDPIACARRKKEICSKYDLVGSFPLDNELTLDGTPNENGYLIASKNEELMHAADCVIANMTPFRSASMDVGTAFEMGFMRALGKPVFAYTNATELFKSRTEAQIGDTTSHEFPDGAKYLRDRDGNMLEDFGLVDNLMLDGAVNASTGGTVHVGTEKLNGSEYYEDLAKFEDACKQAQSYFSGRNGGAVP